MLLPLLAVLLQVLVTLAGPEACSLANRRACQAPQETETGPLLLSVSISNTITDLSALSVTTTLINTGSKTLKILNDPNSPISLNKTHSFDFYKIPEIGAKPSDASCPDAAPSNGVVWYDYDPYEAAKDNDKDAYIVLAPKQKKTVVKDLSGMYMFNEPGLYTVQVTQSARYFAFKTEDNSVDFTQAKILDGPAADKAAAFMLNKRAIDPKTSVAKRAARTDFLVNWQTQPMFRQCTADQQAEVKATIAAALERLKEVNYFLSDPNSYRTSRWMRWFGGPSRARWVFVRANYLSIGSKPTGYQYDCTCTKCDRSAFTVPKPSDKIRTIYLCKKFWWASRTGSDSKAGLLIREASNFEFFGKMKEYALDTEDTNRFATDNPAKAVYNTGSYRYFAEDAYVSSDLDSDAKYKRYRGSMNRPSSGRYRNPRYRDWRYRNSRNRNSNNRPARYRPSRYRPGYRPGYRRPKYRPGYRPSRNPPSGRRPADRPENRYPNDRRPADRRPADRRPNGRRPNNRRPGDYYSKNRRPGEYYSDNRHPKDRPTNDRRPKDRRPKRPPPDDGWRYDDAWAPDNLTPTGKGGRPKNGGPAGHRPTDRYSDYDPDDRGPRYPDDSRPFGKGGNPKDRRPTDRRPTHHDPEYDRDRYYDDTRPSGKGGRPKDRYPDDRRPAHRPGGDGWDYEDPWSPDKLRPSGKDGRPKDRRPTDYPPTHHDPEYDRDRDRYHDDDRPSGKGGRPKDRYPDDRRPKHRPGDDWDYNDPWSPDHTKPSGKDGRPKDRRPTDYPPTHRDPEYDRGRYSDDVRPSGKNGRPKDRYPDDRNPKYRPEDDWNYEDPWAPDHNNPSGKNGRPKDRTPTDRRPTHGYPEDDWDRYPDNGRPSGKSGSPKDKYDDHRPKYRPEDDLGYEDPWRPDHTEPSGKSGQPKDRTPGRHPTHQYPEDEWGYGAPQYSGDERPSGKGGHPEDGRPKDKHPADRYPPQDDWHDDDPWYPDDARKPERAGHPKDRHPNDDYSRSPDGDDWLYHDHRPPQKGGTPNRNPNKTPNGTPKRTPNDPYPEPPAPKVDRPQGGTRTPEGNRFPKNPPPEDIWGDDEPWYPDGARQPEKNRHPGELSKDAPLHNGAQLPGKESDPARTPKSQTPTDAYPKRPPPADDWEDDPWYPDNAGLPGKDSNPIGSPNDRYPKAPVDGSKLPNSNPDRVPLPANEDWDDDPWRPEDPWDPDNARPFDGDYDPNQAAPIHSRPGTPPPGGNPPNSGARTPDHLFQEPRKDDVWDTHKTKPVGPA